MHALTPSAWPRAQPELGRSSSASRSARAAPPTCVPASTGNGCYPETSDSRPARGGGDLHLPEPVLPCGHSLGEVEIVAPSRRRCGARPAVAQHLDREWLEPPPRAVNLDGGSRRGSERSHLPLPESQNAFQPGHQHLHSAEASPPLCLPRPADVAPQKPARGEQNVLDRAAEAGARSGGVRPLRRPPQATGSLMPLRPLIC